MNTINQTKKSWALMAIEEEEEEEIERINERKKWLDNQLKIRRDLYLLGLYTLEEGEILE